MSQENVEVVRRFFEATDRRDVETMDELFSEDGEFHSVLAASEGRVFRGRQGVRDYFAWFDDSFDEYRIEIRDVIDAGENRAVAMLKFRAHGRASGISLDQDVGMVVLCRDNQIIRMQSYFDPAEALAAVGLAE